MRPVSVVENAGFNHLISVLEPRYELPSRLHMTTKVKVLPAMYENVKARINEGLSHAELIALTTDGWNSRVTLSCIIITAHYINKMWEMESPVLQTLPIYDAHTSSKVVVVVVRSQNPTQYCWCYSSYCCYLNKNDLL